MSVWGCLDVESFAGVLLHPWDDQKIRGRCQDTWHDRQIKVSGSSKFWCVQQDTSLHEFFRLKNVVYLRLMEYSQNTSLIIASQTKPSPLLTSILARKLFFPNYKYIHFFRSYSSKLQMFSVMQSRFIQTGLVEIAFQIDEVKGGSVCKMNFFRAYDPVWLTR